MTCKKEWKQGRDRTTIYVVIESCKVHPYIVCAFTSYSCPKRICRDVLCTWFNYHVYCSTIPTLFPFFFARHPYITLTFLMFFYLVSVLFLHFFQAGLHLDILRLEACWLFLIKCAVWIINHSDTYGIYLMDVTVSVKIIIESKLTCICFVFSLCIKHKERRPWCDSNLLPPHDMNMDSFNIYKLGSMQTRRRLSLPERYWFVVFHL